MMTRPSFARLATSTKMLIILTVALLPLGLIALFASVQSDRAKRLQRQADAQVVATAEARQVDILLLRGSNLLRAMLAMRNMAGARCDRMLSANQGGFPGPIRLALIGPDGDIRCATAGFQDAGMLRPIAGTNVTTELRDDPDRLRFATFGPDGSIGVGELPLELLTWATQNNGNQSVTLRQGHVAVRLARLSRRIGLDHHLTAQAPVAGGQVLLRLTLAVSPVSAVEVLLVLLPLLMWGAAAAIGWIVINHLLLRPLALLQRAVNGYRPGDGPLLLPPITTPAHEIGDLAVAFAATTAQLAEREAALERGLDDQVRLTREVHHRVKNNLQVVASLINLHSRGTAGEVAAAYAAIQRRVDALAVVHRNHYAELEENHGVALRSIIAELTGNLRATAPQQAGRLTITIDISPVFVSQDVAVPVAFLVTETVELAMTCDPSGTIAIRLVPSVSPDRARLTIAAAGLATQSCLDHPSRDRFQRVATGLSRQLRASLDYDSGQYAITIPILPTVAAE